ncbi:CRTAC1 family protein [Fulvivirga lutea]|uniref:CRTAC1 family protein n=1 Tax=Fulvivirga lutea TaxID=2810512 RepID=A0A975A2E8_9BACT|nr:CRTAC1 family protein [Fulvivirga lutea]QSE99220.1 CRTAC1 family protein [Fulvivirga lutea]
MKYLLAILLITFCSQTFAQQFTLIEKGEIATDTTNTNGASFVDYDNDGDLDIFLSNANTPFGFNTLYKNQGNDVFEKVNAGEVTNMQTVSFGHTWGDYDNDGLLDLFVVNAFTNIGSLLYKNLGNDKFQRNENYNSGKSNVMGFAASWRDFDNDGYLDLTVIHPAGGFVGLPTTGNFLFKNNGDQFGSFTEELTTPVTRRTAPFTNANWVDYDMDGDSDLFIGSGPANGTLAPDFHYKNMLNETGALSFQQIRNTTFANDSLDGQTWNWIDIDNDGDLDAYMTNWGGVQGGFKNNLYLNKGDTIVRVNEGAIVNDIGISLANVWADFDNDGDLDVYVGNGGNQPNRYYENDGKGNFTSIEKGHFVETAKNTWGVSAGDYNNDGRVDLFVSNKTGYIRGGDVNFLYRNDTNNNNNWIIIKCVGEKSNKTGIGTKIKLTSKIDGKAVTQYREIGSNATFLGINDLRAHFGLNKSKTIDKVELIWPSGQVDRYENVNSNQILVATEGKSLK